MTTPPDPRAARETAAAALARAEAATPWRWIEWLDEQGKRGVDIYEDGGYVTIAVMNDRANARHDARFIVAARADVPALAALVTALADEVERLGALLAASDGEAQ